MLRLAWLLAPLFLAACVNGELASGASKTSGNLDAGNNAGPDSGDGDGGVTGDSRAPGDSGNATDAGLPSSVVSIVSPSAGAVIAHTVAVAGACSEGSVVHVTAGQEARIDVTCTNGAWSANVALAVSTVGAINIGAVAEHPNESPAGANVQVVFAPTTFYVAPNGSDSFSGSIDSPVATIARSRDLAAAAHALNGQSITVNLRGGLHGLLEPLVFGPEHSGAPGAPIIFRGMPGESAILHGALMFNTAHGAWSDVTINTVSGARSMKKFTFAGAARDALVGAIARRRAMYNGGAFAITEAFLNGGRLVRSRHPNVDAEAKLDFLRISDDGAGHYFCPGHGVPPELRQGYLMLPRSVVDPVASSLTGNAEIVFTNVWQEHRAIVTGVNVASAEYAGLATNVGLGEITPVCSGGYEAERAHLENALVFVDQEGEWYLDENEPAFYLIPSASMGDLSNATLQIPVNDRLIDLRGTSMDQLVHDLEFHDFDVMFSGWHYANGAGTSTYHSFGQAEYGLGGAIDGNFVTRLRFGVLHFSRYGQTGIALGGSRTGQGGSGDGHASNISVESCNFVDGGGGAIRIDNRPPTGQPGTATNNVIRGNVVSGTGRVFRDSVGILSMFGSGTVVAGNIVSSTPYTGISAGWGCAFSPADRHEVTNNDVRGTMMVLRDGGGIYIAGSHGIVSGNYVEYPGANRAPDAPEFIPHMSLGIYNDDGASYWRVIDNITHKVLSKSATNIRQNNTYAGSPAILDPPDNELVLGAGGELNCRTRRDGSAWQTPPTWW